MSCWHEVNRFECTMRGLQTLISDTSSRCVSKKPPNNPSMSPTCNYLMRVYHKPHLKDSKKYWIGPANPQKSLRKKALILSGKLHPYHLQKQQNLTDASRFPKCRQESLGKDGRPDGRSKQGGSMKPHPSAPGMLGIEILKMGTDRGFKPSRSKGFLMLHMTFAIMWYVYYVCV